MPARPPRRAIPFAPPLPLALAACALLACRLPPGDPAASTTTAATSATSATTTAASTDTAAPDTTSPTTTTDTTDTADTAPPLAACPSVPPPTILAKLADPRIDEPSGLARSRSQPGVFWTHNDSGDGPRFFAVDDAGQTLATFILADLDPHDWEDLSLGPGPTPGAWLYLGDIGDNLEARKTIAVHRLPEPDALASGGGELVIAGAEAITLTYPDGPHDAEALLVDPLTGDLLIATKGDPTRIYRAAAPLSPVGVHLLEEVAPVVAPLLFATGGDVSPAGDFLALRTYDRALLWLRPPGGDLTDALAAAPCILPLAHEIQGEALAIAGDGRGYYTVSEMPGQPLWRYVFE